MDNTLKVLEQNRSSVAVRRQACLDSENSNVHCRHCVEDCPLGAITWDNGPQIQAALCTECGICSTVCPGGAFQLPAHSSEGFLLAQVRNAVRKTGWVAFVCKRMADSGVVSVGSVVVNCLGSVLVTHVVGAAAYGARQVRLLDYGCQECDHKAGQILAAETVNQAEKLLKGMGQETAVKMMSADGLEAYPGVRINGLNGKTKRSAGLRGPQDVGSDPNGNHNRLAQLPARRSLLLAMMRLLARPAVERLELGPEGLFARVRVNGRCTGCQSCVQVCPTGALTRVEHEHGQDGVGFHAAHCTNCGLCEQACINRAILVSHRIDLGEILDGAQQMLYPQPMRAACATSDGQNGQNGQNGK